MTTENQHTDVYERLARFLDDLPAGFPRTENGTEMRLLRQLFTPEEAELALHLTLIPETAKVIAHRAGITVEEVSAKLGEMSRKGLIYSIEPPGKPAAYMANQMVIGIWEYHVTQLSPELVRDMNEYIPVLMHEAWKVPQLRTIPVKKSLTATHEVMTYEIAEEIIGKQAKIAVAPCICRRERKMEGEGCDRLEEACLIFGSAADYYVRNGMGRYIDQTEARGILQTAETTGLVLQPGNAQKPPNICCCCGCCCGVLRTLKKLPRPVEYVSAPFYARIDQELCEGCEACADRCQMDAFSFPMAVAELDPDRCIGCGLCVTTCPSGALTLVRKKGPEVPDVPKYNRDTYIKLGKLRGKLNLPVIARLLIQSKIDRLRAGK
jgi:formate hydrogenlyase subunit 6/NADH:ubiquinone oxidoreductase subunit I